MEKRIYAGRYVLIKTKGSNGRIDTHLVEDPLSGDRVFIKIFAEEDPLALEHIKLMNNLKDHKCRGMVMPLEGGMLEEEPGYYMVLPEVPGPTLEEYLALGPPMEEEELRRLVREVESTLQELHDAGFFHLFVSPRNIFYSPGRPAYLKDPALSYPLYSFFMQELQGFDYSYFSPRLMDGGEGCPEDDFYSLGKLILEVIEKVEWVGDERARQSMRERAVEMARGEDAGFSPGSGIQPPAPGMQSSPGPAAAKPRDTVEEEGDVEGTGEGEEADARRAGGFESLKIDLEGMSMDENAGQGWDMGATNGARKMKRSLLGAAFALVALCAVLLLAYGLPARSDGGLPAAGQGRNPVLQEEAEETAAQYVQGESGAPPEVLAEVEQDPGAAGVIIEQEQAAPGSGLAAALPDKNEDGMNAGAGEAPPANQRPIASFSASPSEGGSPLQVYLDAGSSYDPDGDIVSYSWSCGGSGVAVYRVFESSVIPARISITLTVTDSNGDSSSATRSITLY